MSGFDPGRSPTDGPYDGSSNDCLLSVRRALVVTLRSVVSFMELGVVAGVASCRRSVARTKRQYPVARDSFPRLSKGENMGRIRVWREPFWAGVLLLVATLVLSTFYGEQSNPPYGVGWDFVPLFVTVAIILLLVGTAFGNRPGPVAGNEAAGSADGTR